jgi:hypothetical protein
MRTIGHEWGTLGILQIQVSKSRPGAPHTRWSQGHANVWYCIEIRAYNKSYFDTDVLPDYYPVPMR